MSSSLRAVVTGLGAVSPYGRGAGALWEGLAAGRKALAPITLFPVEGLRCTLAGEVPGYPKPASSGEPTRAERFLRDALAEALADARLAPDLRGFSALGGGGTCIEETRSVSSCSHGSRPSGAEGAGGGTKTHTIRSAAGWHEFVPPPPRVEKPCPSPLRAALFLGTNFGGMSAAESALSPGGAPSLAGYDFAGIAARAAAAAGLGGSSAVLSVSCASGAAALVVALEAIRAGRADLAVAAGFDELSLYCMAGLSALRATSPGDIAPFDVNRAGTVFSEGAGALVVEERGAAERRGARILCELAGGAANNDAYHLTAPEKEGRGIVRLMRQALADAGASPEEIGHVNLHGTGTKYNDLIETRAIKEVFGGRARELVLTANKSMLGHSMGAAGAHESIAAVRTLVEGLVPPTVGIGTPDPECDLDYCPGQARRVELRAVLKNSYGIGGVNASVVFRKV